MNKKILTLMLILLVLLTLACRLTTQSPLLVTPSSTELVSNNQATPSLPDNPTPPPTEEPSQISSQTVFDPATIGNIGELNSYVLSTQNQYTYTNKDGTTTDGNVQAIGEYVKEPKRYHITRDWKDSTTPNGHVEYFWVEDKIFGLEGVSWFIHFDSAKPNEDFVQGIQDDIGFTDLSLLKDAHFVGQEDCQGIPCYHFTFDQTNYTSDVLQYLNSVEAQGNIYLARNGNYPIHYDEKSTKIFSSGTKLVKVVTRDLSSINQLTEISLPADIPQVNPPDIPLPDGTELVNAQPFLDKGMAYTYDTILSVDEAISYYLTLSPNSGWSVSYAELGGEVAIYLKKNDIKLQIHVSYDNYWNMTSISVYPAS